MIRHILIPASGTDGDDMAFATALTIARADAAHLQFLHVRLDVIAVAAAMTDGGFGAAGIAQGTIDQLEADANAQADVARKAVGRFCAGAGVAMDASAAPGGQVTAEFGVETGDPADWIARHGRFADLVVARRPVGEQMSLGLIDSALTAVGRPVLIAGTAVPAALPDTVVIAWKDRPESARAVAAAMPFIERARRVIIVSVEEEGAAPQASCEQLLRSLRWHNPAVEIARVPRADRAAADIMEETATRLGAGLLVMGGYSHTRLRETIFGGFTRHVLQQRDMTIPVLMMH